ncbi:MAG: hypothetical protein V4667_12240 [Bacteroidota bacterium]
MKKLFYYSTLILCLLSVSAFSQSRKDKKKAKVITKYSLSFVSKGEGYDAVAKQEVGKFIKEYEIKKDVILRYFEIPWGREGEFDLCFNLDNMSKSIRKDFVNKMNKFIEKYPLVQGITNEPCRSNREEINKAK